MTRFDQLERLTRNDNENENENDDDDDDGASCRRRNKHTDRTDERTTR